jgi:hypothetical protein
MNDSAAVNEAKRSRGVSRKPGNRKKTFRLNSKAKKP